MPPAPLRASSRAAAVEGGVAEARDGAIEAFLHENVRASGPSGGSSRLRDNLYLERAKNSTLADLNAQERGTVLLRSARSARRARRRHGAVLSRSRGDIARGNLFTQPLAEILQSERACAREGFSRHCPSEGALPPLRLRRALLTDREKHERTGTTQRPHRAAADVVRYPASSASCRGAASAILTASGCRRSCCSRRACRRCWNTMPALWQSCPTCTRRGSGRGAAFSSLGGSLAIPRARNLHRAAQVLVNDCGGGISPHARGASAPPRRRRLYGERHRSIAFGEPEPAVDGIFLRVAARVGGIAEDIMDARVRKRFSRHAHRKHRLRASRRMEPGDDGSRRDGLPAERRAAVRKMPLPAPSAAAYQKRHNG